MPEMGTKVKHPTYRPYGQSAYWLCPDCGKYYTNLGAIRHARKCRGNLRKPISLPPDKDPCINPAS